MVSRVTDLWGEGAAWRQDDAAWAKEAMLLRVDATKARVRLGWRPRLAVDDALAWTVEWYKVVRDGRPALAITTEQIARYEALAQDAAGAAPLPPTAAARAGAGRTSS